MTMVAVMRRLNGLFRSRGVRPLADERGANLVEFAFASTVFLMTVFGTLEFGIAVWRYNIVSNLAQEGARWASVRGTNGTIQATQANVLNFVQTRANGINVTVTTSTTTTSNNPSTACASASTNPGTLSAGDGICVTVSTSYAALTGFIPAGTIPLTSTAKMVMAR